MAQRGRPPRHPLPNGLLPRIRSARALLAGAGRNLTQHAIPAARADVYISVFVYDTESNISSGVGLRFVPDVVSFRPSPDEARLLERTRRKKGLRSRAAAVRYLIRQGAEHGGSLADEPVFQYRVPKRFRVRRGLTSEEIDRELYGGHR